LPADHEANSLPALLIIKIFNCIIEMLNNNYLNKINILPSKWLWSEKDKFLFAHFILDSSTGTDWFGTLNKKPGEWHSENVTTRSYHYLWFVNIGTSTLYDTRLRLPDFSIPNKEFIDFTPTSRVIGMHGSTPHRSPALSDAVKRKTSKERAFRLVRWSYTPGHIYSSFKSWKKRLSREKIEQLIETTDLNPI
jgi:hypothetical protein